MTAALTRRHLLAAAAGLALVLPAAVAAEAAVSPESVLKDPDAPVGGNPHGDVTIVTYFDYNCPYCKESAVAMNAVVAGDGNVRVIYKDWPILAASSNSGAELALAAKYQGRYVEAHDALMAIHGRRITAADMRAALAATDIDMTRLDADLKAHRDDITALLRRTTAEAEALGLSGTPVYLVGPFMVPSALDEDGFRQIVSDARARSAASRPAAN
ncbi:DsbA family protein [Pseudoxanthobacter sp.]|uniref:DsbA family protein n=1 Tax=Pseudoxanthobacter sp. TaxID=1925742 RepID=UPI002FE309B1